MRYDEEEHEGESTGPAHPLSLCELLSSSPWSLVVAAVVVVAPVVHPDSYSHPYTHSQALTADTVRKREAHSESSNSVLPVR